MPAALSKFNKRDRCEICSNETETINHHHLSSGYIPRTTYKSKENKYGNLILGDSLTNGMEEHEVQSEIGIESFGEAEKSETSPRNNLPQMKHVGTQTKETILDEKKGWFPQIYCNIL